MAEPEKLGCTECSRAQESGVHGIQQSSPVEMHRNGMWQSPHVAMYGNGMWQDPKKRGVGMHGRAAYAQSLGIRQQEIQEEAKWSLLTLEFPESHGVENRTRMKDEASPKKTYRLTQGLTDKVKVLRPWRKPKALVAKVVSKQPQELEMSCQWYTGLQATGMSKSFRSRLDEEIEEAPRSSHPAKAREWRRQESRDGEGPSTESVIVFGRGERAAITK
ncbi:hypothetical protein B0H11DRAFT_1927251 [Mycena galericulata]|nr:hypothetical protein B0H11DRAFT_1927251 [Mycena galericulata]